MCGQGIHPDVRKYVAIILKYKSVAYFGGFDDGLTFILRFSI